jgi:hypothetical protein
LKIGELIRANRHITVLELSQEVGISAGSVEEILHNELKVSTVSARWVPRLLSPEHRERRLVAVTQLLQRYEREGAEVLDSVVICNETWVHCFTPGSRTASKQCNHTHSLPPKKAKAIFSAGKMMTAVFWDSKGIIHLDLAPSEYHLFGPMKRVLGGKRFRNNDEFIAAVQSWIHKQPKPFFETGTKKLPERWHKCMTFNRDYIEKFILS